VSRPLRGKIKTPKTLATILRREQKKGRKVVFTNGCFDLLHKGHVTYLEKARQKGDLLVVAINSDASVRKLKGPDRPLNPLPARQAVMAALESVDYVTFFGQETPLALIRLLRPDILVKGGDYRIDQIVGAKEVVSWGGKVLTISFVKGHSTTKIISRAGKSLSENPSG
jgi:D-beta-D-heptose 7-phosphate kinase/D-beta-D-heptose 1-phosphate adenosyltransferase